MAQTTSELWKTLWRAKNTTKEYSFDVNGVWHGPDAEVSHSAGSGLYEEFGIGNATIAQFSISLIAGDIPYGATIKRYIRLKNGGQVSEWLPKGVFFANRRPHDGDYWTIEAYDAMRKAEAVWEPDQSLEFPLSMPDAVAEFARIMGIEIDPRTSLNAAYTIDYPASDTTIRSELCWIAAAHGGNWIVTDVGKLLLVPLLPGSDHFNVGLDLTESEDNGKLKPISRVTLWVDDNNCLTAGDDTGLEISADCPHATQAMVDSILAQIEGYQYQAYSATDANIDPAAELGDSVTADGMESVIARMDDDGSGYVSLSAPGEEEMEDEYPAAGPMTQKFDRKLAETRSLITKTAEEIRLEVANEVQGLSASFNVQLGSISAEIVGVENAISSLELDMESILGRIQDAEGNVAQLELTAQEIRSEVSGKIDEESAQTLIDQAIDSIALSVTSSAGSTTIKLTGGGVDISTATLNLSVAAANISGKLTASQIDVSDLKFDTLWASDTKVAAYASGDMIHIGGRSGSETFSSVYLHGSTITLNRWSDSASGIVIENGNWNYKVYPGASNLYSLGDSTHLWAECYTNSVSIVPNSNLLYGMTLDYVGIIPAKTEYMNLGSSTYKWNNLYVKNIVLDGTTLYPDRVSYSSTIYASMNSAKAFVPYASTGYSIGSSIFPWATGYFTTLYVGGKEVSATPEVSQLKNGSYTVSLNTSYALVPGSSSYSLGSSSYYWGTAYITKLYLSSTCYISAGSASTIKVGTTTIGGTVTVSALTNGTYSVTLGSGALTPKSSGSYSLGSSSYYWSYLYVGAIRLYYSSYSYITLTANSSGKLCVGGTAIH